MGGSELAVSFFDFSSGAVASVRMVDGQWHVGDLSRAVFRTNQDLLLHLWKKFTDADLINCEEDFRIKQLDILLISADWPVGRR
mmetsp:Transcript_114237/g.330005  ORF Transcript_114237/g.330005 Transcript_114237/m.330005 type:complete len:84 (-) Transcript_114237:169-420(-)